MTPPSRRRHRPAKLDHAVEQLSRCLDAVERSVPMERIRDLGAQEIELLDLYYASMRHHQMRPSIVGLSQKTGLPEHRVRAVLLSPAAAGYIAKRGLQDLVSLVPLAVASVERGLEDPKKALGLLQLLKGMASQNIGPPVSLPEVD